PIVVILGHVDHGKTTLLDYLRKSNVAAGEIGGITQSTRAFQVGNCTFIDTPGHAAFSNMRLRGNNIADMAILIVAGDDGVMPQTTESAKLLMSGNTPFVVAINKTDLPTADVQKVYAQLSEIGVLVEGYGGTVPVVSISAKTGAGIPELLEMIGLVNELNPAKSDPDGILEAVVLESRLDSRRGPLAIAVIKNGTLTRGLSLFTNHGVGKAKSIVATTGELLDNAGPATPVEILGLSQVIPVGHSISSQIQKAIPQILETKKVISGIVKIILKADTLGSLEAITAGLNPQIELIYSGVGDISESEILTAAPLDIPILGFGVQLSSSVTKLVDTEKVRIKSFSIIYELLDYADSLVQKTINPRAHERILGEAVISAEFDMNGDHIAGCKCLNGQIAKTDLLHLNRGGEIIQDMKFRSLKSAKSDVNLVKSGAEFGAVFSQKVDFRINDCIIAFTIHD
ncbi:MAG: translation initiation factor IF-2, partial [Patescibacteria group bacterium]